MKTIAILGSRDISPKTFKTIRAFAHSVALAGHRIITGGARGTDHAAICGCLDAGKTPLVILPLCLQHQPAEVRHALHRCELIEHPDHIEAGYISAVHHRNMEIVEGADLLLIFHWGSAGSRSYIRYASKLGKPFRVFRIPYTKLPSRRRGRDRAQEVSDGR